ncbi:aldo/keto reductase [Streptomyces sp. B21-108]|uniref:aldo/keto reductase n=1 Tax=Streptomyces sp. B21-108 TaxID=3039419 RepID=UPI003FA7E73C
MRSASCGTGHSAARAWRSRRSATDGGPGDAYDPGDEQEAVAAIRRATTLGVTFFDTAEFYGRGPVTTRSCSVRREWTSATRSC